MFCLNQIKTISTKVYSNFNSNHLIATQITCFHKTCVVQDLMEFFDNEKNWNEPEVKTGREWRKDELRIKSNQDLHKLWYVLYKERNMLKTMQESAEDSVEAFPSPERIDKVQQSMINLEAVVRERNKAYWELEVGEGTTGERPKAFRRDIFGRWKWMGCSEHLVPYRLNSKWRALNAPGFGPEVTDFIQRLKETKLVQKKTKILKQRLYIKELLRRFPDTDPQYLQELYPDVNIQEIKDNLVDYVLKFRRYRFHKALYESRATDK